MLVPDCKEPLGAPRKRRNLTDYKNDGLGREEEENLPISTRQIEPVPDLSQLAQDNWTWFRRNELSTSDAQFIDSKNVFFHPNYSHGTAAAMGNLKLTKDKIAYWEIHVEFVYGTSMMFGIGKITSKISLPYNFENLIGGSDGNSYGLSHKGVLYNNGFVSKYCVPFPERQPAVVGIFFDGINRELSYFINGEYCGVAFHELDLETSEYYPMISSTSQKSHFTICQQLTRIFPTSLSEQCLNWVAKRMQNRMPCEIKQLGLPEKLIKQVEARVKRLQKDVKVNEIDEIDGIEEDQICQALSIKRLRLSEDPTSIMELDPSVVSALPHAFNEYLTRLAWSQYTPL